MLKLKSFFALSLPSVLFLLNSCTSDPVSSQSHQDVSISAETVSSLAFMSIAKTADTDNLIAVSNPAPANMLDASQLPRLTIPKSLSKSQAGQSIWIDTLDDFLRLLSIDSALGYTKSDTIEFLPGDAENQKLLSIRGSTVYSTGKTESYKVEDLDGDDLINGDTPIQQLQLETLTTFTKDQPGKKAGTSEHLILAVDAGEDNDFDAADDNRVLEAQWVRTLNSDTLGHVKYSDADGDGIISGETGALDVLLYESNNPFKPLQDYGRITMRIEKTDGTERTVRFAAEKKLITGRLDRIWVVDSTGDSSIGIGEKAFIHLATNNPSVADSQITAEVLYIVDPGANLALASDNVLYGLQLTETYRWGMVKNLRFSFTADPPVTFGTEPSGGSFQIDVVFVNDKTASLSGTFSEGELNATYIDPEGKSTEINIKQSSI